MPVEINSLDMASLRKLANMAEHDHYQLRDLQETVARLNREAAPVPMYICRTTSTITAFNSSTNVPGYGTATIYDRRGTNTTATSGGTVTSTNASFTVFNLAASSVNTNTFVFCMRDAFGDYWIVDVPFNVGLAVLSGDLASGGSATASFYTADAGTETSSGTSGTVYDWMIPSGKEIVSGTHIVVASVNGYWYVIASAACPTAA